MKKSDLITNVADKCDLTKAQATCAVDAVFEAITNGLKQGEDVAIAGFGKVRQSFFPPSNTPMFFIDLWLPQGTDIRYTEQLVAELDQHVL